MRTFNEYSREAARIWISDEARTAVDVIGLTAEAGEVADHFKKALGHGKPLDGFEVAAELGDVLWYLDRVAARAGYTLQEVATMNVAKLRARYPNGFEFGYRGKDEKRERVAMALALRHTRGVGASVLAEATLRAAERDDTPTYARPNTGDHADHLPVDGGYRGLAADESEVL